MSKAWGAREAMATDRATFLQRLRHGMGFMMNRKLAVGFGSWHVRVVNKADDPMAKALRHMINRELSRGWLVWWDMWGEAKSRRESMRKSLGHLLNRNLSKGWRAWIAMILDRRGF